MLVCVPAADNGGMEAAVYDHFGSAPYFVLHDTGSEETEVIENRNSHHSHGTCHPMNQLARYKIDAVICAGMGRRAVEALSVEGVKVMTCDGGTVREAIDAMTEGKAEEIDPARACRGRGQHQTGQSVKQAKGGRGAGILRTGRGSGFGQGAGRGQSRRQSSGRNRHGS